MKAHHEVIDPKELLKAKTKIDQFEEWITDKLTSVLGSFVVFLLCFIIPLVAVPASVLIKLIVGIIFSNWFQAWALPVLQRSQNKTQAQNDAKMATDHRAITYLANLQDEQMVELKGQTEILEMLKASTVGK